MPPPRPPLLLAVPRAEAPVLARDPVHDDAIHRRTENCRIRGRAPRTIAEKGRPGLRPLKLSLRDGVELERGHTGNARRLYGVEHGADDAACFAHLVELALALQDDAHVRTLLLPSPSVIHRARLPSRARTRGGGRDRQSL